LPVRRTLIPVAGAIIDGFREEGEPKMDYAGDPSVDLDAAIADAVLRELLGTVPAAVNPRGPGDEHRAAVIEAVIAAAWPDSTPPTVDELDADGEYYPIAELWDPLGSEPFHVVAESVDTVGDHSFGSIDPPQDHW
jgi:hypothetical protein